MTTKVFKNYLYNLSYQLLSIIIPFITTPYVSRVLGASGVGKYNYVLGIVSCFSIVAATGTIAYGQREIAKVQQNVLQRSKMFWEILIFRLIFSTFVLIIYVIYFMTFLPNYRLLFFVNLFTVFSWFIDVSWYFQGVENFKVTSVRNSFVKIMITILIFAFVKKKSDVWIYTLIYAIGAFLGNATMLPYLKNEIKKVKVSIRDIFSNFRGIMELFFPVIAIQLYTVINKVMLGSMSNNKEVGYYSQAYQVINVGITVIYSFVAVLTPRVSSLYNKGQRSEIRQYVDEALENVYFMGLPMMFGCIAVANEFVPIFFSNGYFPVIKLMKIMSCLFVVLGMDQLLGVFLIAMNKQRKYTFALSVAAVVNLVLNFIFLRKNMGSLGAAYATVISEIVATTIQIIDLRYYISKRNFLWFFVKYLLPSILMYVVMLIPTFFLSNFSILSLCLRISLGILCYLCFLILTKNKLFLSIVKTIFPMK